MDETGFRIGCGRSRIVITVESNGTPKEPPRIADPDNREHLTDVECVNAEGEAIQPMLIFRGSTLLNRYSANSLHREVLQGYSESGYINDDLAIEWMRHFIKSIQKKWVGEWTLLLLDGCISHKTYPFWKLAIDAKIILFKLPAHSTHLLQPLDVGVFRPFKQYHGNEVDRSVRVGNVDFNKLDFLGIFQDFRARAFTKKTITHAWKHTGIVPYNPSIVLEPMRQKNAEALARTPRLATPETPTASDVENDVLQRMPRGPASHHKHIEAIRDEYASYGELGHTYTHRQMFRFLQGTITQANTLALHTRDLDEATKASAAKAQREAFPQTVASSSGVMYVGEMRINHSERLSIAKQKAINKANKLRRAVDVAVRVAAMQYEREAADEDVYAAEEEVIAARTALQKIDAEVDKYTGLERQVNASIQEDKRLAEEENRAYEACIDRGLMQPPWNGDGEYISPYHPDNPNDFAPRYRLQRYRYKSPRVDPLAFLDDDVDEFDL